MGHDIVEVVNTAYAMFPELAVGQAGESSVACGRTGEGGAGDSGLALWVPVAGLALGLLVAQRQCRRQGTAQAVANQAHFGQLQLPASGISFSCSNFSPLWVAREILAPSAPGQSFISMTSKSSHTQSAMALALVPRIATT